ncbi:MAG TPA: DUF1512 domain-containing protein [Thermoprotei archaeon]|nr:DUF1512 domain-containing protein [Thermoprotei archaeon]
MEGKILDGQTGLDWILWFLFIFLLSYISREMEIYRIIKEIETYLLLYGDIRRKAIDCVVKTFKDAASKNGNVIDETVVEQRVLNLVETVFIEPVSLDPYGIINKLKHLIITSDETMSHEVRMILPSLDNVSLENLKDLISAAHELNYIYKAVDHLYRMGKKFKSLWILMQLQAQLPIITEYVRALESSLEAFSNGFPIGDSAGPLVVNTFVKKNAKEFNYKLIAEKTILIEMNYKDRKIYVIKAQGPSGVTGRLDDALYNLFSMKKNIKMIITVDAALKYEGEKSGLVIDGIGVAIGGIGVEKFNIEKLASEKGLPLYAILVKMSIPEALSIMSKEVTLGVDKAVERVEKIIEERTDVGDEIILIGVGNTVGVFP